MLDLNSAPQQREGDVIPDGTIAVVQMTVRPGSAGEGGWLKRSKDGGSNGLDAEFTVVEGPHAKRKFWKLFTLEGSTSGHQTAADISRGQLRAMIESARGIRPDDESEQARAGRVVSSWGDFDGIRFIAKIGVEPATGDYKAKNTLAVVITPDKRDWQRVEQIQKPAAGVAAQTGTAAHVAAAQAAKPATQRPAWAS